MSAHAIIHVRIHVIILAIIHVVLHVVVLAVDRAAVVVVDLVQTTVVVVAVVVMAIVTVVKVAVVRALVNAGKAIALAHAQFIAMMKQNAMVAVIRSVAILHLRRVDGGTYYGRKDYPSNEAIPS